MNTNAPVVRSVRAATPPIPYSVRQAGRDAQYVATAALLKLLSDTWNDWQVFAQGPKSTMGAMLIFGNLAPDFVTAVSQINNLPRELQELTPDGVDTLLKQLSQDLSMPSDHAERVLGAALKLARDAYNNVVDVMALIAAAKS